MIIVYINERGLPHPHAEHTGAANPSRRTQSLPKPNVNVPRIITSLMHQTWHIIHGLYGHIMPYTHVMCYVEYCMKPRQYAQSPY